MRSADRTRQRLLSALLWLAAAATPQSASGKPPLAEVPAGKFALQLHSVRQDLERDLPGTLRALHDAGIRKVEFSSTFGRKPAEFAQALREAGLAPIAAHFPLADFKPDPTRILEVAEATGVRDVGVSWIASGARLRIDQADVDAAVRALNGACPALRRAGLRVHYHVHGYEFVPTPGGTLLDDLVTRLDRRCVGIELDVFWAAYGGADPAELLRRYGKRITMLHLKDIAPSAGIGAGSFNPETDNVPVGAGHIDFPSIIRLAKRHGVRWYVLEDETRSALSRLPAAISYFGATPHK